MSIYTPDWDKIIDPLNSTTTQIGGAWANLISDYFSGVNIGLIHPTKRPKIGTTTFFKLETLKFYDNDESHTVTFSVDDIDDGDNRIIKIRRMNAPYIIDHMVMEGMPQAILNKDIDSELNNITNIVNADIKVDAGITDNKLARITDKEKLNSNVVYTDQANTFTAQQKISFNGTVPFVLHKPINTQYTTWGLDFDANDSANAQANYAKIWTSLEDNSATSKDSYIGFSYAINNSIVRRAFLGGNGIGVGTSGQQLIFNNTGLTGDRTITAPDSSGMMALVGFSNVFTAQQVFRANQFDPILIRRSVNTNGSTAGINFQLLDSNSNNTSYAQIFARIGDNTDLTETGYLDFHVMKNGTLAQYMVLDGNQLHIGPVGARVVMDSSAITTTSKVITWANLAGTPVLTTGDQIISSKTWDVKNNTFLRLSRVGIYTPGSDNNASDNTTGVLKGLVGLGSVVTLLNTGGKYHQWATAGTIANDVAGVVKLDNYTSWRIINPVVRFAFLFVPNTSSDRRIFKGWGAQRLLTLNSDTAPLGATERGFLFGHGAGDTAFHIFHNDGTAVCVKTTTGVNLPGVITNYILEIQANDSVPNFVWTLYSVASPGVRNTVVGTGTISTRIPSQTAGLYLQDLAIGSTTAVQHNNIHYIEVFTS